MGIKEKIEFLIGVLKTSTDQKFEDELKAIEELENIAFHAYLNFEDKSILEVILTPSKYEDIFMLGIYIDTKVSKVFMKSVNTDIDFVRLNKE